MRQIMNTKVVAVTPPAAIVDNAAFTTTAIDTLGFRFVTVLVILGALDIAVAAMKLQESDDSGMSGATDVPLGDFSVLPATLPSASADNNIYAIQVDMRGRKRYLDLSLTGGDGSAGSYAAVIAVLSEPEQSPNSAATRGFAQELIAG